MLTVVYSHKWHTPNINTGSVGILKINLYLFVRALNFVNTYVSKYVHNSLWNGCMTKLGISSLVIKQKTVYTLQSGKCQTWLLKLFNFFVCKSFSKPRQQLHNQNHAISIINPANHARICSCFLFLGVIFSYDK